MLRGHYGYFGLPHNWRSLAGFLQDGPAHLVQLPQAAQPEEPAYGLGLVRDCNSGLALAQTSDHPSLDTTHGMTTRVTSGKSRVRESRLPGSVRAEPNRQAIRPLTLICRASYLTRRMNSSIPPSRVKARSANWSRFVRSLKGRKRMGKTLLMSAACFSLGVGAFAYAQTAPVPPGATPPGSTESVEPGANATSPAPVAPDQGSASGATTSGGTSNEPTSAQPAEHDRGSVDSTPANGKGIANGEGTAGKQPAAPDQGSATGAVPSGGTTDKQRTGSEHARPRSHAVTATAAHPAGSTDRSHRRSPEASHLPAPPGDENASAEQFLRDAQTALRKHHTDEAQEALERAETRVLEGTQGQGAFSDVHQSRVVQAIEQAREALGHRRYLRPDVTQAGQSIDQALAQSSGGSPTSGSDGPPQSGP